MSEQPAGTEGRARAMWRAARRGLVRVAVGPDRPIAWPPDRLRWLKWLTRILVVVATIVLYPVAMRSTAGHAGPPAVVPLLAVTQLLPLALILRRPLLGWRVGIVAAFLEPVVEPTRAWGSWPWDPVQIPVLGAVFIVAGLRYGRAPLWTMYALMALVTVRTVDGTDVVGAVVLLTVVTALVDTVGGRLRAQRALEAETERTELEKARRAVLEERTRIARELHDVVAHHMSLIAVQAETARYRRDDVTEGAAEEFASIGAQAREALQEMRRLLGVLRSEETALRAPQPGLRDLADLVDGLRRAGAEVTLSVRDEPDDAPPADEAATGGPVPGGAGLPAAVQVCVYRVVQEALSNATRHAPGTPVTVDVAVARAEVRILVRNGSPATGEGRGAAPGPAASAAATVRRAAAGDGPAVGDRGPAVGGHGLVGMRERVALLGGRLTVGPVAGGYRVAAVLPVPRVEPAPEYETTV